jgi:hypothetical protein
MSANDAIVLKANFEDWKNAAGDLGTIDPWLYYCIEQFLKPYSLDDDEVRYGITDKGNDGGADGLYMLVNQGQLLRDDSFDARYASKARIVILQVKTSGGMKPTEIEKWLPFADDFFDLSRDPKSFGARYHDQIKTLMRVWRDKYIRMAQNHPELSVDYFYITGDDAQPDDYALDACKRVEQATLKHVNAQCRVHCIGARELWSQVQRRPPKSRTLAWAETPMAAQEGSVGLVRLTEYCKFLADSDGELAERIFDDNVRGFQQDSTVNQAIAATLMEKNGPNFWLLNNGVTIITNKTTPGGHKQLVIEDPQIVNGLQTSRVIFSKIGPNGDDGGRTVLVRVIETADQATQDRIIRATNSQNKMLPASLRMTDQIHRDIEELFRKYDIYYDRRKGFYRDQGQAVRKIVGVNAVAQAVISLLLQRPDDARARPGDYFKDDARYNSVFADPKIPVSAYLTCVQIMQRVEAFLVAKSVSIGDQKNLKFYIGAWVARELSGLTRPVASKLLSLAKLDDALIDSAYKRVLKTYHGLAKTTDGDAVARGSSLVKKLNDQWKTKHSRDRKQKHAEAA